MSQNAEIDPAFGDRPPTWSEISRNLVKPLAPMNERLQEKLLESTGAVSGFLRLAQMYEAEFNRKDLEKFIEGQIQDHALRPGELHKILVRLPWTDIFTTNWDTLLERAGQQDRIRSYYPIVKSDDFSGSRRPRIVKLHGTIGVSERCIFTEEDFRTYPTEHATFVNSVRQSITETIMVLIGFSGEDPNFLNWTGWVRDQLGDFSPRIYLIDDFQDGVFASKLLAQRNVIPLDLGQITAQELDNYQIRDHGTAGRLEFWLRYLLCGEQPPLTIWPLKESRLHRPSKLVQDQRKGRPVHLNSGPEKKKDFRVFFSSSSINQPVSIDSVKRMKEEIEILRNSYRKWVIMPADARDDVRDLLRYWSSAFRPCALFDLKSPVRKDEIRTGQFLRLCFEIMSQPDPRTSAKKKFSGQNQNGDSVEPPSDEEIDTLRRWIDGDLFLTLRALLSEYLWICDASHSEWPEGVFRALPQIMAWSPAPEAKDDADRPTGKTDEGPQPERIEPMQDYSLAISYLYRGVEHGASQKKWSEMCKLVKLVAERADQADEAEHHIATASMLYARDHGARQRVLELLRPYITLDQLPADPLLMNRLAGIADEVAEDENGLAFAHSLRVEVYRQTQEKIGSIINRFDAISLEAWNLALQHKGSHSFLTEALSVETGMTLNVQLSVDTRLDQLKSLRCDPLRELRRADRNVSNTAIRRQSVRIFDAVGFPLIVQSIDRYQGEIVYDTALDNFIENSLREELNEFQDRAKQLSLSRDAANDPNVQLADFDQLDRNLVQALRLLFRISANPKFTLNDDAHRAYMKSIENGAQFFFDLIPRHEGLQLDPACIHFCLDAMDQYVEPRPARKQQPKEDVDAGHKPLKLSQSAANTVQAAMLALGNLLLSRRTGRGPDIVIAPELALKAIRVLSKIRLEKNNFKKFPTELLPQSMSTDRRLLEGLLRFSIDQSLKHHQRIRDVFQELAKNINGHGDPADLTFVEPFRLLDVRPESRKEWECPTIIDDALRELADKNVTNPDTRANLIRIVDALDDWNCKFSAKQRREYEKLIKQEFGRKGNAASLERWEWMMIEVVRKKATENFLLWAFGEAHSIDASNEKGREEAISITRNLYWAICQRRTELDLSPEHVLGVLDWINRTIKEYNRQGQIEELTESTHFRDIFFMVFGEMNKLEVIDDKCAKVALATLVELHGLGVSIEPVIPHFAERFSHNPDLPGQRRRLGAILREGLATIHYDNKGARFDATIKATLSWVKASTPKTGLSKSGHRKTTPLECKMKPPPPSLLGALGQALAVPATARGGRVLEAIRLILIQSKHENDRDQLASDVLFDIQRRVDTLLEAKRKRGDTNSQVFTEKILRELTQIHKEFLDHPTASNYSSELQRLGKSIESLRPEGNPAKL